MKRVISLILVLLLTAALAGCGASGSKDVDVSALAAELAQKVEFSAPLKELTADFARVRRLELLDDQMRVFR